MLVFVNIAQTILYIRIRKYFNKLPLVSAKITHSELLNHTGLNGQRVWEARIRYIYSFRGKKYEGSTPALRSPQLFGPAWGFETRLVEECKVGDFVNVRVVPAAPELAYIKIAPFSFWSAVLLPVITVLYAVFVIGYFWLLGSAISEGIDQW